MKDLQVLAFFSISLGSLTILATSIADIRLNASPTIDESYFDTYTGGASKTNDWR